MRLKADQDDVLRFLTDARIPPTNNDAERRLRPAKLHDKISGGFRNAEYAQAFVAMRSYLGTAGNTEGTCTTPSSGCSPPDPGSPQGAPA